MSGKVGTGEHAHAWAHVVRETIELSDESGSPIVLTLADEPEPHVVRLMQTLGVTIEVKPVSDLVTYCPRPGCTWSFVGTAMRAKGFLDKHVEIMHAGSGVPSPALESDERAALRARVAVEARRREEADRKLSVERDGELLLGDSRPTIEEAQMQAICKTEGCSNAAPARGRYAGRCAEHRGLGRSGVGQSAVTGSAGRISGEERDVTAQASLPRPVRPSTPAPSIEVAKQEEQADASPVSPFALALTGGFGTNSDRVKTEAAKLRAQAEALDVIAQGLDMLQETVAA